MTDEPTCDMTKHQQIDAPKTGDEDYLHDDASERLDFPADGHVVVAPATCLSHVGAVNYVAPNDGRLMSKLANTFFNRLRRMCL